MRLARNTERCLRSDVRSVVPAALVAFVLALWFAFVVLLGPAASAAWADETDAARTDPAVAGSAAADSTDTGDNAVNPRQTPDNSFLYDTSIDELVHADSSFQGSTVQITGEVVGDAIRAEEDPGKHWITMEALGDEDDSSISVLIDDSYLGLVDAYGKYGVVGTTLQVRGTFYLTCTSHEGIMDIHADTVKLVERGRKTSPSYDSRMPGMAVTLLLLGGAMLLLYYYLRERQR